VQLAARLVHGVNNNASAIESIQVVLMQRKRISAFMGFSLCGKGSV
jgi:ABC-type phosphate transport system ATPase subunit